MGVKSRSFLKDLQGFSKHEQPFFSVIIPCYNCNDTIGRTLDSVASQDFQNFELIVVDDGSTDESVSVVEDWAGLHPGIPCLVKSQPNRYQGAARNTGIRLSHGKFVAFLDADDVWEPPKLTRCFEEIENHPEIDVVCHNEWLVREGIRVGQISAGPHYTYEDMLFHGNCLSPSATIVRKEWLEKVKGFDESPELFCVEDYDLWMRLAREGAKISYIHEPMGEYTVDRRNTTVLKAKLFHQNELNLLEKHYANWPNPTSWHEQTMQKKRVNSNLNLARSIASEEDYSSAWELWFRVFKRNILSKSVWSSFLFILSRSFKSRK